MKLDEKILNEIARYNSINNYIMEQDIPPPPVDPAADPAAAGAPPADPAAAAPAPPAPPAEATPVDIEADKDVEEIPTGGEEGAEGEEGEEEGVEEIDITDLVDSQKTMADKQEEYFNNLFDLIKKNEYCHFFIFDQNIDSFFKGTEIARMTNEIYRDIFDSTVVSHCHWYIDCRAYSIKTTRQIHL